MNRMDRLLGIVIELQRKGSRRAVDLADRFETSVRTIYRDMQALSESGVPIVGSPGQGYSLMDGYFLPPVHLTAEEAVSLLMGTEFVEQQFDPPYSTQAESSRHKIESVLPAHVRARVEEFRESTKILTPGRSTRPNGVEMTVLARIRGALLAEKKVRFRYTKPSTRADEDRETERTVAPYGLVLIQGAWMLIAHCDLRNDIRHFRLSRIRDAVVLNEPFVRPADFELRRYAPKDDRQCLVHLQFQPHLRDAVLESDNFFMESMAMGTDAIDVTLRVRQPKDVLKWVLSWGAGVEVTEPHAFRLQVRSEIEKMLRRY